MSLQVSFLPLLGHQTLTFVFQLMELHQQAEDILLQDVAGCTLLHHAVEAGSKEILKYLIDNGGSRTCLRRLEITVNLFNYAAFVLKSFN